MVLDELFAGGATNTGAGHVIDEETWDAMKVEPKPWYEEYWWMIPLGTTIAGGIGYGIYRATK